MTERLFDKDSYIKEFSALCIKCLKEDGIYKTVLDKTAFFPEGGGQKSDTGFIDNIPIFDVQEENGVIYHYSKEPVSEHSTVSCRLNWRQRFAKMQNHTAEHIISGLVHKKFGFDNTGFHLGEDFVTMDYNGTISKEAADEIENAANDAVWADLPIEAWYPENPQEYAYRSKLDLKENIRLVKIGDIDLCACCAPHLSATAQVGLIKILSCIRFKGGVRITAKCGSFALEEFKSQHNVICELSKALSLPKEALPAGVSKLFERLDAMRFELVGIKKELLAQKISLQSEPYVFVDDCDALKDGANLLFQKHGRIVGAFCGNDDIGYRFMLIYDASFASKALSLKEQLNASGGGRDNMLQGSAKTLKENIIAAFNALSE